MIIISAQNDHLLCIWSWYCGFGPGIVDLVLVLWIWSWYCVFGPGIVDLVLVLWIWSWYCVFGPGIVGVLFSIIAALESLTGLLCSVLWPAIYPATLHHDLNRGTTYFIMASISFISLLLVL